MIEVGRVCVKIAGRDAGKTCVVIDVLDKTFVTIDGQTRRRKANRLHLEPTKDVLDLKRGASHEDVAKALKSLGVEVTARKPKQKGQKPTAKRMKKEPKAALEKVVKKKLDEKVKKAAPKVAEVVASK